MVRRPLQCIGRDALLSRLYGADAAVDVAPFPAPVKSQQTAFAFVTKQ